MSIEAEEPAPEAGKLPSGRIARTARAGGLVTGQGLRWAGMRTANRVRSPERAATAKNERTAALVNELVQQLGRIERLRRGHPFISVPAVDTELSTRRVLVSEYLEGERFETVRVSTRPSATATARSPSASTSGCSTATGSRWVTRTPAISCWSRTIASASAITGCCVRSAPREPRPSVASRGRSAARTARL
jgi:hypothetical protein